MLDSTIPLPEAKMLINRWRDAQGLIRNELRTEHPEMSNSPVLTTKAFTFNLNDLQELLSRIYLYNSTTPTPGPLPAPPANPNPINAIRLYPGSEANNQKGSLIAVGVKQFHPNLSQGGEDVIHLPTGVDESSIYSTSFSSPPIAIESSILDATEPLYPSDNYTLSLQEAQTRITNWQSDQHKIKNLTSQSNSPVVKIQGVTMLLTDLHNFLKRIAEYNETTFQEPPVVTNPIPINAVRLYFGKCILPNMPVGPFADLVCVGVTSFDPDSSGGNDITDLPSPLLGPPQTGIFDFSYPCPTTCPDFDKSIMDL